MKSTTSTSLTSSSSIASIHDDIITTITKGAIKGQILLSKLREYVKCYTSNSNDIDEILLKAIITLTKDCNDNDSDRKILRICIYLICDIIIYNRIKISKTMSSLVIDTLKNLTSFSENKINHNSDIKNCILWKALGIINCNDSINSNNILLIQKITTTFKKLEYPIKQKSLLNNKKLEKDFDNQLLLWSSIVSSLYRTGIIPPVECYDAIMLAAISNNAQLARHGIMLLNTIAKTPNLLMNSSTDIVSIIIQKMVQKNDKKEQTINQDDILCCSYLLRTISSFTTNDIVTDYDIVQLYINSKSLIEHKSPKVCSDAVKYLLGNSRICKLEFSIGQHAYGYNLINCLSKNLEKHLSTIVLGDVSFPVLLRACIYLGNYISSRRKHNKKVEVFNVEIDNEAIEILTKPIHNLYMTLFVLLPVADQGREHVPYLAISMPHILLSILEAMIWLCPDDAHNIPSHYHGQSWNNLNNNILTSIRFLSSEQAIVLCNILMDKILTMGSSESSFYYSAPAIEVLIQYCKSIVTFWPSMTMINNIHMVWRFIASFTVTENEAKEISDISSYNDFKSQLNQISLLATATSIKSPSQLHAQETLLTSLLSIIDSDTDMYAIQGKGLSKEAIYHIEILKSFAFWELAENALIYVENRNSQSPVKDLHTSLFYGMEMKKISSLSEIIDFLLQTAWTSTSNNKRIVIEGLIKIAVRIFIQSKAKSQSMYPELLIVKQHIVNELEKMTESADPAIIFNESEYENYTLGFILSTIKKSSALYGDHNFEESLQVLKLFESSRELSSFAKSSIYVVSSDTDRATNKTLSLSPSSSLSSPLSFDDILPSSIAVTSPPSSDWKSVDKSTTSYWNSNTKLLNPSSEVSSQVASVSIKNIIQLTDSTDEVPVGDSSNNSFQNDSYDLSSLIKNSTTQGNLNQRKSFTDDGFNVFPTSQPLDAGQNHRKSFTDDGFNVFPTSQPLDAGQSHRKSFTDDGFNVLPTSQPLDAGQSHRKSFTDDGFNVLPTSQPLDAGQNHRKSFTDDGFNVFPTSQPLDAGQSHRKSFTDDGFNVLPTSQPLDTVQITSSFSSIPAPTSQSTDTQTTSRFNTSQAPIQPMSVTEISNSSSSSLTSVYESLPQYMNATNFSAAAPTQSTNPFLKKIQEPQLLTTTFSTNPFITNVSSVPVAQYSTTAPVPVIQYSTTDCSIGGIQQTLFGSPASFINTSISTNSSIPSSIPTLREEDLSLFSSLPNNEPTKQIPNTNATPTKKPLLLGKPREPTYKAKK